MRFVSYCAGVNPSWGVLVDEVHVVDRRELGHALPST
ncbi:MAG: hypothetical protein RLZZ296_1950, partial [Pseudomonadota bacterium]